MTQTATQSSLITPERIERAVMQRHSPFPELTMEGLSAMLNQFRSGELRHMGRVMEVMIERDGDLAAVIQQRFSDVARLPLSIEADDESTEAERHAEALRYCYKNLRTSHAIDSDMRGGTRTLINQIMSAHAYRYSVHEMHLRLDNEGKKEATYELRHCPVYWFEARRGYLAYLPYDGATWGSRLEDGMWLRAVGHGYMRQCAVGYLIKWLPMAAWVLYTHRFGIPGIHGETDAKPGSKEWADFENALIKFANDWVAVTNRGAKVNLITSGSTGDAQFEPLIDKVDRMYAKLWRGGDLSTNSREMAVGASVQGQEKVTNLDDDAAFVMDVLNEQIDRPLIRYLFGVEPKAWARVSTPKPPSIYQEVRAAEFLVSRGVRLPAAELAERFGFRIAADDEETLEVGILSTGPGVDAPGGGTPLANERDDMAAKALSELTKAMGDDMRPIREELERISNLSTNESRRDALMDLMERIPTFAKEVLKAPSLAEPLGDMIGTAYFNQLAKAKK